MERLPHSGADYLSVMTIMALTMVLVASRIVLALLLPTAEVWPYFLLEILQAVYSLCLVAAYRIGDLGQV